MLGEKPKRSKPPLEAGDCPELDTSDSCTEHETSQYQTLIGQLQWLTALGRLDIQVLVMSISTFRAQPRKGHLTRVKRSFGYLACLCVGAIEFQTHEPDYSSIQDQDFDWAISVYGNVTEHIAAGIPNLLGKFHVTTHYVDASLLHDDVTGRSVTAVLHLVNGTPAEWYSKRQATAETATYGSEFVAARTAVDQIVDLRYTLMYLGVPVRSKSYLFGDNLCGHQFHNPKVHSIQKAYLASYHC